MVKLILRISSIVACLLVLHGCAAALVGGGAAGASIASDRRTTGTVIEDQSIELKALKAISENRELSDSSHLSVTSYNLIVLLTGETPTDELRRQAVEIVSGVEKVTHVHNEIAIAAPSSFMSRSSDSIITSKVKTKLLADKEVKGLNIKVVTDKGVVYLMGIVSRQQSELATEIARQTGGVQKVVMLFEHTD